MGIIDDDATKKMKANAAAREKQRKEEVKQLNKLKEAITEKYDSEIRLANAAGKDTEMLERKKRFAILETLTALNNAERARVASGKATQDEIKSWNERQKEIKKINEDIKVSEIEAEKEKNDRIAELRKEQAEKRKEQRDKEKEEAKRKAQEEKDALKKAYDDAFKISEDARLANEQASRTDLENLQAKFEAEKAILEKQKIDTNELEIKYLNDKNAILLEQQNKEDEIRKAKEEADKQAKEEELQREIDLANAVKDAKFSIANQTIQLLTEVAGEGAKVGKALAVAQATISGIEGVQNAFSTAQKSPVTTLFPAYPFVQAGLAGAFSALQIKKILSTNPSSGGGSSAVGGSGGGSAPTAPSFNLVQGTGSNQIAESLATERQPVQAYVVA